MIEENCLHGNFHGTNAVALVACALEKHMQLYWERNWGIRCSLHSCLLSLLSHPCWGQLFLQLCPNLFTSHLKSLEFFNTSKTNSPRERNWDGQTTDILADKKNPILQKWECIASSLVTHRKCCWEYIRNTHLHVPYSQIMANTNSTRGDEHWCIFSPVGGIALK